MADARNRAGGNQRMSCLLPCWIPSRYPRASAGARPASARWFATWSRSGPTAGRICSASGGSVATGRCWACRLLMMLRSCQARPAASTAAERRAPPSWIEGLPTLCTGFGSMVPAWIRRALRIVEVALINRWRVGRPPPPFAAPTSRAVCRQLARPIGSKRAVPVCCQSARRVCHQYLAASPAGSDSAIPFIHLSGPRGLAGLRLMAKGLGGLPSKAPDRLASQRRRPACCTPGQAICSKRLGYELKIFSINARQRSPWGGQRSANDWGGPANARQRLGQSRQRSPTIGMFPPTIGMLCFSEKRA